MVRSGAFVAGGTVPVVLSAASRLPLGWCVLWHLRWKTQTTNMTITLQQCSRTRSVRQEKSAEMVKTSRPAPRLLCAVTAQRKTKHSPFATHVPKYTNIHKQNLNS